MDRATTSQPPFGARLVDEFARLMCDRKMLTPLSSDPLAASVADWEIFAQEDPLWAILTHPLKQGGRWSLEEFLATGEGDVTRLIHALQRLAEPVTREAALDFGCGVGRVTLPLARRFARVVGLDAAPTMVVQAERLN